MPAPKPDFDPQFLKQCVFESLCVFSSRDTAKALGVSIHRLKQKANEGQIRCYIEGAQYKFPAWAILEFVDSKVRRFKGERREVGETHRRIYDQGLKIKDLNLQRQIDALKEKPDEAVTKNLQ